MLSERDPLTGRFVRGNTAAAGHGRPHAARVGELRQAMLEAVGEDELRGVVRALLKEALKGNVPAAKLVLSYSLGAASAARRPGASRGAGGGRERVSLRGRVAALWRRRPAPAGQRDH